MSHVSQPHMKFYLLFQQTGDFIPFVAEKPDLVEYYVNFLNERSVNKFSLRSQPRFDQISRLQKILREFNDTEPGKLISFKCANNSVDLLDQDLLNCIHCEWVHSNHATFVVADLKQRYPSQLAYLFDQTSDDIHNVIFSEIVYKYGLENLYSSINMVLHDVESIFNRMLFKADFCADWGWIETANIFPKKYTSNSQSNLSLNFNHYGRTLQNKFRTFDHNMAYDDENTFNQLLGYVQLSLLPSETIAYSPEYLQWCQQIGREPGGNNLNIGTILELEKNLFEYRKLLYRNLFANNNCFSLSFSK
jgi:hypothetical protein